MADLTNPVASAATWACCEPVQQTTCCEPEEKTDCCVHGESTCGCSAAAGSSPFADIREVVRARYAPAASADRPIPR